ncbi:hypothetical protein HNY73_017945 [Argiope bruennichi]|uniref:Uncharacterized protein n=1 Tax=Argiope bruennichi TaxID=94029 RepID=A0A8T0EEK8_ARGBR|nr:hypothetical protein HNY73_017945 [Argiope bruennichi]
MPEFLDVVKYRLVALCSTKDIIECSFIVQNSLSYLNLELSAACIAHEFGHTTLSYHSGIQYEDGFVSTEEKCRKKFDPNRYLMYTLHLDLPKERNVSLRHGPDPDKLVSGLEQFSVGKLSIYEDYYPYILAMLTEYIFEHTDNKLRATKWLLKFDDMKEFDFGRLSAEFTNYFIDFLYPKFVDSELMKQFILKCNLANWIEGYEKPEILEKLLYHAHRYGRRRIEKDDTHDHALPNLCIFLQSFANVGPLLKYRHAPAFCSYIYSLYINVIISHG